MKQIYAAFECGDMQALYLTDTETGIMGLTIIPGRIAHLVTLEGNWCIEPLVQLKIVGDSYPDGFSHGHSMRNSETESRLKVRGQWIERGNYLRITTVLDHGKLEVNHILEYLQGSLYFRSYSKLISHEEKDVKIEMISSYNLCAFPVVGDELRMEDLVLHRMQSKWSMEGKMESTPFLDLQLEPAWLRIGANNLRFGQVGSMPVRRYFPWMVAEDTKYNYRIGIQLAHSASWQMEVYNRDDRVAFSGGLADREFGHWMKTLKLEEVFETPMAVITASCEDLDGIAFRLTSAQIPNLEHVPGSEKDLPVIYNEYCTSWGNPTEESVLRAVTALKGRGVRYCVIDAGWHVKDGKDWSDIGDWVVNEKLFPNGLGHVATEIRKAGMIPGLWYEMEVVGKDSDVFHREDMLLKRDGYPIQTGCRRFLDMNQSEVKDFLKKRVIDNLKENGFGYLKVDYNDNIGIGCDGAESLGEGLRKNQETTRDFFRKIREEIPDIVIENCSSGGHRLEPSMMELCSMASFSDAHEWNAIPVIAANVTRAVLPAQSQIWAVLRKTDDEKRLYYSLCSTFLGRMCLSGDVCSLEKWQWNIIEESIEMYRKCAPVIRVGRNFRQGPLNRSYHHLQGWQAVCRKSGSEKTLMAVVHSFETMQHTVKVQLPEAKCGKWKLSEELHRRDIVVRLDGNELTLEGMQESDGAVMLFEALK